MGAVGSRQPRARAVRQGPPRHAPSRPWTPTVTSTPTRCCGTRPSTSHSRGRPSTPEFQVSDSWPRNGFRRSCPPTIRWPTGSGVDGRPGVHDAPTLGSPQRAGALRQDLHPLQERRGDAAGRAQTHTRSSCRSTRRTSSSSAAGRSPGWRRSSVGGSARTRSASALTSARGATRCVSELLADVMPEDLLLLRADPRVHRPATGFSAVHQLRGRTSSRSSSSPRTRSSSSTSASSATTRSSSSSPTTRCGRSPISALERETGARGLRSIIETALLDVMFELPRARTSPSA